MAITEAPQVNGVALPPAGTYRLDPDHTAIEFVARHMLSKVRGRFTDFSGTIEVAERPEDSSVAVTIVADSVQTNSEQRDQHLRSKDFFGTDEHPELRFESTAIRIGSGNDFELEGELTIRGITKPITLEGTFEGFGTDPWGGTVLFASARAAVERADWDLTWNVAVETGGWLVGKTVDLELNVEAKLEQ
jgi:polyisoprenoid-binding protein YceI